MRTRVHMQGLFLTLLVGGLVLGSCAQVTVPDARNVDVPVPVGADKRKPGVNERLDSVMYLPLGDDVLIPSVVADDPLPNEIVGPFELRSETLAGALQLILADYDVSLAFETDEGLSRQITVANLKGPLNKVVDHVCSLADLYCAYQDSIIIVKNTQTFTVTLPPLSPDGQDMGFIEDVAGGLTGILGPDSEAPVIDETTRTIIYTATQRTAELAARYFQHLRASTAMIVFESYIWEVSLNSGNSTGIDWSQLDTLGKFNYSFGVNGSVSADFTNPISIGLPTTQNIGATPSNVIQFLSRFGAVKTISQPQITLLSGSTAELRVADTNNFVSQISTTIDEGQATTSVQTDSVETGFTLGIRSSWDRATVYADIEIELTNVIDIEDFTFSDGGDDGQSTTIQLPQTSEREVNTQVRVRPGDSILIAGLVRETDNYNTSGPGIMKPIVPSSRTATTENLELVFLLRPRVVAYTSMDDTRYLAYIQNIEDKRQDADRNTRVDPDAASLLSSMPAEPVPSVEETAATSEDVPPLPPELPEVREEGEEEESVSHAAEEPVAIESSEAGMEILRAEPAVLTSDQLLKEPRHQSLGAAEPAMVPAVIPVSARGVSEDPATEGSEPTALYPVELPIYESKGINAPPVLVSPPPPVAELEEEEGPVIINKEASPYDTYEYALPVHKN